jgi:hypothetical protein
MHQGRINVCVVKDSTDIMRGRTCFWSDALQRWSRPNRRGDYIVVTELSLPEEVVKAKYIDFGRYDVVVFNWDVLNGDPTFSSDRSQNIARYYARDLSKFIDKGGLVIVEAQATLWSPCQEAYDSVLVGAGLPRLRVIDSNRIRFGFSVRPNRRLLGQHPFLPQAIGQSIRANLCQWNSKRPWFPDSSVSLETIQMFVGTRSRMYSGAFSRLKSRHWQPILFTEDGRFPVACVYHRGGRGACLVTTMYLAASNVTELLRPMTVDWHRSRRELGV